MVMEGLLDYLLFALFGHDVTSVLSGRSAFEGKTWTICLEERVYFTLDKHDLDVIRDLYEERKEMLSDVERERYFKIFDACC